MHSQSSCTAVLLYSMLVQCAHCWGVKSKSKGKGRGKSKGKGRRRALTPLSSLLHPSLTLIPHLSRHPCPLTPRPSLYACMHACVGGWGFPTGKSSSEFRVRVVRDVSCVRSCVSARRYPIHPPLAEVQCAPATPPAPLPARSVPIRRPGPCW